MLSKKFLISIILIFSFCSFTNLYAKTLQEKLKWANSPVLKTFLSEKTKNSFVVKTVNNFHRKQKKFLLNHPILSFILWLFFPLIFTVIGIMYTFVILVCLFHLNFLGIIGAGWDLLFYWYIKYPLAVFGILI